MDSRDSNRPHGSPSLQKVNRKACDICKRRKVRCNGGQPCQNCVRQGVSCQYTASHGRLAQAERRVTVLQERLRNVEAAWKRYLPEVDLTAAIQELDSPSRINATQDTPSSGVGLGSAEGQWRSETTSAKQVSPPDSEYEDADTLDWDESIATAATADGIASLSINWRGIGYMGHQTGNTLLRKLQSISVLHLSPNDDDAPPQQRLQANLPDSVLKSSRFSEQCIEWYFKYFHSSYPILHEGHFRAQHMGALRKPTDGSWPVLLNAVLAIGACSGDSCDKNADFYFYGQASSYLSWDLLRRGTLSLVQAFALLAYYLQKRNKPNSGFTLLGIAMNMAQGIGLHRELSGPAVSTFTMEIRRRVWWTLFVFDAELRLTFGRPTLSLDGVSTKAPRNLDDHDIAVDLDVLPPAKNTPTVTSALIWQSELAKIANRANARLVARHLPDQTSMLALGEDVLQWATSLPNYMRAEYDDPEYEMLSVPRMVLLWRSTHLRINIYRPFLIDDVRKRRVLNFADATAPSSHCFYAAEECVTSIGHFFQRPQGCHGLLIWYGCYWLVTAIFVYVTCMLYDPENASALSWRQQIEDSKTVLEWMGNFEPTAVRAALVLDKILALIPTTPDSTFFALNEHIRMELAEDLWNQSWADMNVPQGPLTAHWLSHLPVEESSSSHV